MREGNLTQIRDEMKELARAYREKRVTDPVMFLKKMDELTRRLYQREHPELCS